MESFRLQLTQTLKCFKYINAILLVGVLSFCGMAQSGYYHPTNGFNGIEDVSGTTKLIYMNIMTDGPHGNLMEYRVDSEIYLFDPDLIKDTIIYQEVLWSVGSVFLTTSLNDYKFWGNDCTKCIRAMWSYSAAEKIKRFDEAATNFSPSFIPKRIFISGQNDSLLFASDDNNSAVSLDGGRNWQMDSLISGGLVQLDPHNDSVMFFRSSNSLYKTSNRGLTFAKVDSLGTLCAFLISKDGRNLFRVESVYSSRFYSILKVSSEAGTDGSWQSLDSSNNTIQLSIDEDKKELYVGDGRTLKIYSFTGQLISTDNRFKYNITGLYKKAGTDILYVESAYAIFEMNPDTIKVIQRLEIPWDYQGWYSLQEGNEWVYEVQCDTSATYFKKVLDVGTCFMGNCSGCIIVKTINNADTITSYQQYDPYSGEVLNCEDGKDSVIIETFINVGDSVHIMGPDGLTHLGVLEKEETATSGIGYNAPIRTYSYSDSHGDVFKLSLQHNIGIISSSYLSGNVQYSNEKLVAAKIGYSIYGDKTLLDVTRSDVVPVSKYELEQNYPNPFNPSTSIRYAILKAGQVKLRVYSVTGKLVASLVDEYKPAGNYTVNFNAANLPSGVYFYRLTSGSFVENKKMILLK